MVPNDLNEYNMRNMWCAAFCTCSVLMTFSNKLVVQGNPVGIAAVQMLFSVVALLSLGPAFLELSSLKDVGVLVRWIPVPIFFVGMIVTSLSGFAHETITTCILMGSLRPIYAIPVEMFFLGERPSFEQVVGCLVLIVGTLIYVLGARSNAASVTLVGFLILCLNGIMAVGDRVYQRYLLHHQSIKASRLALVLANNLMGVVYIACIPPLYLHELPGMKRRVGEWIHGGDWADLSLVLVSCVAGFGIGYTGLGLQKLVTASTFLAISTGVRAFIVITDLAIMGTSAGGVAVFGLMVTIFGSVLCAMEDQAKKAKASAPPAAPEPAEDSEIAANPNPDSETAQTQQLLK
jgi:drug/metabolite transporter (DMT)-like permease